MTPLQSFKTIDGYIPIRFPGCLLLATKEEFKRMLTRGKWFKRSESTAKRNKAV